MEEGLTARQELEARQGAFEAMLDEEIPANERVDFALHFLAWTRNQSLAVSEPFRVQMEAENRKMAVVMTPYMEAEEEIKATLWSLLEGYYPDQRHDSDVGTAQIVRPKNRISYDTKGLETLRLSSDEMERMIGHLREEKPSTPYLKVKLK